jgi:NAD(P)-dependent dehydrogenase (short-subunit alcohol dehydrogenase family)
MYILEDIFNIKNKVVVISGASRGLGNEIANALSELGADVFGFGRTHRDSVNKINFNYKQLDVNNINDFDIVLKHASRNNSINIDVLINCIGITNFDPNDKIENFRKIVDINLIKTYEVCCQSIKYMGKIKSGSIINITSIGAMQGFPNNPGYIASKGGLRSLTQSLAIDLSINNIRVNNIVPGYFLTDMTVNSYKNLNEKNERSKRTIMNRWGDVSEIVGAVVFLSTNASSYITGSNLVIDGGWLSKGL